LQTKQLQEKGDREATSRTALGDLVLSRPAPRGVPDNGETRPLSSIGMPSETTTAPSGGALATSQPVEKSSWERYARADPKGAIDYSEHLAKFDKSQFEMVQHLSDEGLKIIGGVHDQASYDQAKQRAKALYGQFGLSLDQMNLPDQYSPEVIHDLQMQAMDSHRQIAASQAQQRLESNTANIDADNARADRTANSTIADRAARRGETRRFHDQSDATRRRGQDKPRAAGRGKVQARPTATGPNGERMEYDGKAWVPIQ
jgi:hypothetical protein